MRAAWPLLLAACTPTSEAIIMPPPPLAEGARSFVLVFEGDSDFVVALDVSDRDPLLWLAPGWTSTEFSAVAFSYDGPLASYGLSEGALDAASGSRSCGLTSPLAVARFDSASGLWTAVSADAAIGLLVDEAKFGCRAVDLCRSFQADYVELDTSSSVRMLLPLDESTALMASSDGRFFEVSRSGVSPREDLAGLPVRSGYIDEHGEIWLGGDGVIARGTREGGFATSPLGEAGAIVAAVGTRGEGESLEAIAVTVGAIANAETSTLAIYRYAGREWTLLERRLADDARSHRSRVLWIGDTALIGYGGSIALAYRDGALSSFSLESPLGFEPSITAFAARADAGAVLAASDGYLYRMESPTSWVALEDAVLGNEIFSVVPAFEGFFFGGPDGQVNQYYPRSPACSSERLVMSDVDHAVQLGPDLLVGGANPDRDQPAKLTWLR